MRPTSIPAALGMREHTETYDRIGDVPVWVHDLDRRWREEEARARVFVTPEEAILDLSVQTNVPPQVAWEFLTKPGQRMSWQPWVTEATVVGAPAVVAGSARPTTACTARTPSSRRSSTGARTTTSPTGRSSTRRRTGESCSTRSSSSRPRRHDRPHAVRRAEDQARAEAHGDDRPGVRRGPAVGPAEPRRPARRRSWRPGTRTAVPSRSSRRRTRTVRSPGSSRWRSSAEGWQLGAPARRPARTAVGRTAPIRRRSR